METLFAALINKIPNSLGAWIYPRFLKPSLLVYIETGIIDTAIAHSIGQDMVDAFSQANPPAVVNDATVGDDPVMGFYNIIMQFLTENQIQLTGVESAPLMVKLGTRILNDPDFPEPTP